MPLPPSPWASLYFTSPCSYRTFLASSQSLCFHPLPLRDTWGHPSHQQLAKALGLVSLHRVTLREDGDARGSEPVGSGSGMGPVPRPESGPPGHTGPVSITPRGRGAVTCCCPDVQLLAGEDKPAAAFGGRYLQSKPINAGGAWVGARAGRGWEDVGRLDCPCKK